MFKRTKSKTVRLFGCKFSFFGVLKVNQLRINRPKSNPVLRRALHEAFESLAKQEGRRNVVVALYAAVAHFEAPTSEELAGKVKVFM